MRPDDELSISRVGIPWYEERHYSALLALMVDGALLYPTHAIWLAAALKTEQHLLSQGQRVLRVNIHPAAFLAWCGRQGSVPDSEARTRYASERAYAAELEGRIDDAKTEVYRRVRATSDLLERHVTPVFTYRDSTTLDFEGTGIFGRLADRHYLITAAHVLDACASGVFLPDIAKGSEPLANASIVTARPKGRTRDDDRLDIGFVRMSPAEVAQVGEDNFLDLAHTIDGPPDEPVTVTIALGFPASHQHVNLTTRTLGTAITVFMTGPAEQKGYQMAKVDPCTHVLLRYDRNGMIWNGAHRGSAPPFRGMSGGGVWPVSLSTSSQDRVSQPPLAAMIVEQPAGYATSLLATRAPLIRAFVTRFDES